MSSRDDININISADASSLEKGLDQAVKSAQDRAKGIAKAIDDINVELAQQAANSARLSADQAKKAHQQLKNELAQQQRDIEQYYRNRNEAQIAFDDAYDKALARRNDSSVFLADDKNVKAQLGVIKKLEKEQERQNKAYLRSLDDQGRAEDKLRKEQGKETTASRNVGRTKDRESDALVNRKRKLNEYNAALDNAIAAQDKLAKGEHLTSSSGINSARDILGRRQESLERQRNTVATRTQDVALAQQTVDEKKAAQAKIKADNAEWVNSSDIYSDNKAVRAAIANLKKESREYQRNLEEYNKLHEDIAGATSGITSAQNTLNQRKKNLEIAKKEKGVKEYVVSEREDRVARAAAAYEKAKDSGTASDQAAALRTLNKETLKLEQSRLRLARQDDVIAEKELLVGKAVDEVAKKQANLVALEEKLQKFDTSKIDGTTTTNARENLAKVNRQAKEEKASADNQKAQAEVDRANADLKTASEKLDTASKELVRREGSVRTATEQLQAKIAAQEAADTREIETLNKKVSTAATALKNAERQATEATEARTNAEKDLERQIERRKKAEENVVTARNNVTSQKNALNEYPSKIDTEKANLVQVNKQAIQDLGDREIAAAQKVCDQKNKELNTALKALEKTSDKLKRSAEDVNKTELRAKKAELNVDSTKAKAEVAELKREIGGVGNPPPKIKVEGLDKVTTTFSEMASKVYLVQQGLQAIGSLMTSIVTPGYEYAKSLENARIGIAGIYSSMTEIDGKRTTFQEGIGIANDVVNELTKKAAVTAATPTDLIRTFQGLAGPGLGEGMSTDEIMQYTVTGVNAAKAFQLPATQFIQELRDMVQGGIQPASSTIATALGLKDADIKEMQNSADGLFKSLMNKMQGLADGANAYTSTITGKQELLKQAFLQTSAEITNAFEVEVKGALDGVTSILASIDLSSGNFSINPAILETIQELKEDALEIMDVFGNFDADTGAWVANEDGLEIWNDLVHLGETFKGLVTDVGDMFVAWSPVLAGVLESVIGITDGIASALSSIIEMVTTVGKLLSGFDHTREVVHVISTILAGIAAIEATMLTTALAIKGVTIVIKSVQMAQKLLLTQIRKIEGFILSLKLAQAAATLFMKNPLLGIAGAVAAVAGVGGMLYGISKGIDSFIDNSSEHRDYGSISEKRKENLGSNKTPNEEAKEKAKATARDKADEQSTEKANKQRLQTLQKHLKQINKQIESRLKDVLQQQKEHMKKVELLYKQNQMTVEDYYTEKAQNDKIEAQANIDALRQQKANIESIEWGDDKKEERDNQLDKIAQEMRKWTEQLNKATSSLEDIGRISNTFSAQMRKQIDVKHGGSKEQSASWDEFRASALSYATEAGWDNPQAYVDAIIANAKEFGVNAGVAIEQVWAESNGRQGAQSNQGAIGLMQLMPGTAAGLGVDPYDWAQNIRGGMKYLREMLDMFGGDYRKALAAYNWGPGNVQDYPNESQWPSETRAYVNNIMDASTVYADTRTLQAEIAKNTGYLPDLAHSLDGFDSRYVQKYESAPGATGLAGVKEPVKELFNTIANEYHQQTGKMLTITGAADPTGYHYSDGSQWGHSAGWKIDVSTSELEYSVLEAILRKYGVATGNEGNHLDLSFGRGAVGGTPLFSDITEGPFANGTDNIKNIVAKDEQSLALLNDLKALRKKINDATSEYAQLYGGGYDEEIQKIMDDLDDQIQEANKIKDPKVKEDYVHKLTELAHEKIRETILKYTKQSLSYQQKALEDDATRMGAKVANFDVSIEDAVKRYYQHIYGEASPIYDNLKKLDALASEYQRMGNLGKYFDVRDEQAKIKGTLDSILETWLKAVQEKNSWRLEMLEADDSRTEGQKEQAKESLESAGHRANAVMYGQQLAVASKQLAKLKAEQTDLQEKINGISSTLEKTQKTEEQIRELNEDRVQLMSRLSDVSKDIANYELLTIPGLEQSKALEESLGRNITLLDKVRKAAKQSLEDGLYTFLTDSVNEAQSLGDALANLALTILKSIQQIFAKQIVNQLMNMMFPNQAGETSGPQVQYNIYYINGQVVGSTNDLGAVNPTGRTSWVDDRTGRTFNFDPSTGKFSSEITAMAEKAANSFSDAVVKAKGWTGATRTLDGKVYDSSFGLGSSPLMQNGASKAAAEKAKTDATLYSFKASDFSASNLNKDTKTDSWMTDTTQTAEQSLTQATQSTEHLSSIDNKLTQSVDGTASSTSGGTTLMPTSTNSATAGAAQSTTPTTQIAGVEGNFITNTIGSEFGQIAGSLTAMYSLFTGDTKERLLSLIYLESQLIFQQLIPIQANIQSILSTLMATTSAASSGSGGTWLATGGYVSGPGTSTSDSVPANLSNGEFVVRAASVQKYGRNMLERINSGSFANLRVRVPHFATGGYVGATGSKATGDFAASFGATVSPRLSVNNYVDGKRIFDSYGKDVVRSEVRNTMIKNAKFFSETLGRMR